MLMQATEVLLNKEEAERMTADELFEKLDSSAEHGRKFIAAGTRLQGWSAAAAIIGHHSLEGKPLLRKDYHE